MSEKPVAQKLAVRENYRALPVNEPRGYRSMLG
jgi:hypothetical protein